MPTTQHHAILELLADAHARLIAHTAELSAPSAVQHAAAARTALAVVMNRIKNAIARQLDDESQ